MKVQKIKSAFMIIIVSIITLQSFASGMNNATWYVSIDVDRLQNNEIYQLIHDKELQTSNIKSDGLSNIPKEISHITFYGDAKGSKDATAVIRGDFSNFSLNEHLLNILYEHEETSKIFQESELNYKKHHIKVLKVTEFHQGDEDEIKNVFLSKVNNELSVISFNVNEVEKWLDSEYTDTSVTKDRLLSVEVDVATALAHMGMNLEENSHLMHSEIFKKVLQVSASITEENDDMAIDIALTTSDDATAIQIEQVINGLVAMKNLSTSDDDNELQEAFIKNLLIERNNNNILITTYASVGDVKKTILSKNYNSDNQ